jgi:hypothetical protein
MVLPIDCSVAGGSVWIHGSLEFAARLSTGRGGLRRLEHAGSAAAPTLGAYLTACDVATWVETMFIDARVIRGDKVAGVDGASCHHRVQLTRSGDGTPAAQGSASVLRRGCGRPLPIPVTEARCSTDHVT